MLRSLSGRNLPKSVGWIAVFVVSATSAPAFGQQSNGNKLSFGESPVDAIAAKIKSDLKSAKEAKSTTIEAGEVQAPMPDKQAAGDRMPPPAKPARPHKAVTSQKVKSLEANALKCQTAEEALVLLTFGFFVWCEDFTPPFY